MSTKKRKLPGGDCDHHHEKEELEQANRVFNTPKRQHGKPNNEFKKGQPKNRRP